AARGDQSGTPADRSGVRSLACTRPGPDPHADGCGRQPPAARTAEDEGRSRMGAVDRDTPEPVVGVRRRGGLARLVPTPVRGAARRTGHTEGCGLLAGPSGTRAAL